MKKLSIIIATGVLSVALLSANVSAQSKEEAAIKKAIEQETSTYFHKDYDGWANTWAHDSADYILRASTTGYQQIHGWNAIAAEYKQDIKGLAVRSDAEIAPFLNKTDFHIYLNGNMATATFKEGDKTPNTEARTLVKQNGAWKILNFTLIDNSSYAMRNTINNMKIFAGKWELDGKATMEPSNGAELNSLKFDLEITPYGLEQFSNFSISNNGRSFTPPTDVEYFIPDYNTNTISYLVIRKNNAGQTFTQTGKVTSDHPDSFTVIMMYPNKPNAIQNEYTVTMQDGKWHQVSKNFNSEGKQTGTSTVNLHRVE